MSAALSIAEIAVSNTRGHHLRMATEQTDARRQAKIVGRIKQVIEDKGLKQADIAREINVTPTTMWKYLSGDVGIDKKLTKIARAIGVSAEWLENGGEDAGDPQSLEIEAFVREIGPTLRPPLTDDEARWARAWPYHRVTRGKLLDAVVQQRSGLSAEESAASAEVTEAARAKGVALGVPKRKR